MIVTERLNKWMKIKGRRWSRLISMVSQVSQLAAGQNSDTQFENKSVDIGGIA